MSRAFTTPGTKRNVYRIVMNIKMHLREIRWGGVGWIYLVQDRDHWQAL
jgi:hypothetical protein